MEKSNEFSEYYTNLSNAALLNVLGHPHQYQEAAVEAARHELSVRKLSESDIQAAIQQLNLEKAEIDKYKEKIKPIARNLKSKAISFIDTINPLLLVLSPTEKKIRVLICVFSGLFLYTIVRNFRLITGMIGNIINFPFTGLSFLIPLTIFGIAIVLFWKRKMIGWILLTGFVFYSLLISLYIVINSFSWSKEAFRINNNLYLISADSYIISLIIFSGALYTICNSKIRSVFSIDIALMAKVLGVTAILNLLKWSFFPILLSSFHLFHFICKKGI